MLIFDLDAFEKTASALYYFTKSQTALFDGNFKFLAAYPSRSCEFCRLIRKQSQINDACLKCDIEGFNRCKKSGEIYTYYCHMGITETVFPLILNSTVTGYIILGGTIEKEKIPFAENKMKEFSKKYGIDIKQLENALSSLPVNSAETIQMAAKLIEMSSAYFMQKNIITYHPDALAYFIEKYIEDNLSSRLSIDAICKKFNISAPTLYRISKESFKTSISKYITHIRLEKSKRLLSTTLYPLQEICDLVGINDSNYFIRIFKKRYGITPHQYRLREK